MFTPLLEIVLSESLLERDDISISNMAPAVVSIGIIDPATLKSYAAEHTSPDTAYIFSLLPTDMPASRFVTVYVRSRDICCCAITVAALSPTCVITSTAVLVLPAVYAATSTDTVWNSFLVCVPSSLHLITTSGVTLASSTTITPEYSQLPDTPEATSTPCMRRG